MNRYIDADLIEYHDSFTNDGEYARVAFGDDIDVLPTVDVVEVVRCKDCIHMGTDKCPSQLNDADFYCCQGERREDGEIH